jgi:hypothetical protein
MREKNGTDLKPELKKCGRRGRRSGGGVERKSDALG